VPLRAAYFPCRPCFGSPKLDYPRIGGQCPPLLADVWKLLGPVLPPAQATQSFSLTWRFLAVSVLPTGNGAALYDCVPATCRAAISCNDGA